MITKFIANIIFRLFVREIVRDIIKSLANPSEQWHPDKIGGIHQLAHEAGRVVIKLPEGQGIYLFIDGKETKLTSFETAILMRALKDCAERRKAQIVENLMNELRKLAE